MSFRFEDVQVSVVHKTGTQLHLTPCMFCRQSDYASPHPHVIQTANTSQFAGLRLPSSREAILPSDMI